MRYAVLAIVALATLATSAVAPTGMAPNAWAQSGGKISCPGDPAAASYRIWPAGQLYNRSGIVGTHPCGRQIRCEGGVQMQNQARRCTWL